MIPDASTLTGKVLRLPLRLVPRGATVPVLSGLNRGMKWRVGSSTHGCWLGNYEAETQAKIHALVGPKMVAWDVGANAGFYTLALSRLCRQVVAFEPVEENLQLLRYHCRVNKIDNVTIVDSAVTNRTGFVGFRSGPNNSMGSIGESERRVRAITMDDAVASGLPPPDFVKMDIEGAEADALSAAGGILARKIVWLISTHGAVPHAACRALLHGYRLTEGVHEIVAQ